MPVEPAPVEPLLPVLGAPLPIALPLVLGEALDPPVALEPVELLPSRRQRSFSLPVRLSHWALPPTLGEVVEGEVAEGSDDEPDEPVVPLAEESELPEPPTLCDDDWAIAAAENANIAASVAVESTLNIVASPM
jgi:hypothetical protein